MEIVLFLLMLLPITMLGYCFVRDKQEEDEAVGDPVKTYYLERKRWVEREQSVSGKAWSGTPWCPNCKYLYKLIDMDSFGWCGPEEARLVKVDPKKKDSPFVKAKYKCPVCGYMR